MVRAKSFFPLDPRPSKANAEERQRRKQLEKEHGYGWVPPVVLGLIGLTLAYDVARDVEKCEKRKDEQGDGGDRDRRDESEETARRRRRERRRAELRSRSDRRHRDDGGWDSWDGEEDDRGYYGGSDRGASGRDRDRDGGLTRADRLEKGEGGPWDRDRERERDRRRGSVYDTDDYFDEDRPRRRGKDEDDDYYDYDRGRRTVEDRRGRPRMRRHSSDW
ncbi:hypothetical protein KVR01_003747 [Diaporthe batatas]|uniref:uncharacterized protein n=1 Tax=Diaporthe batatas TaxID=748121 RepID=UPI001D051A7D|nr:uncharacterized protein KVR01_003747 [Diaporthe batatas]KAG8168058.1 hypothetical protein KVR01_003747 [Diaporthe batatas]